MGEPDRDAISVRFRTHAGATGWIDEIWPEIPPRIAPTSPAVPARAPAEPRIDLDRSILELPDEDDHGCGNGLWCRACREEIRYEAIRWIRELNAPSQEWESGPVAQAHRPWHSDLLLGNT